VRLVGKEGLADRPEHERVEPAADADREPEQQETLGNVAHDLLLDLRQAARFRETMTTSISLMPTNRTTTPPRPQMSRFLRRSASAPIGRYWTPFRAIGMSKGMMIALKITADKMADVGECRCITSIPFSHGSVPANSAGMIAKYLATSLGIEKVVSAPRVMRSCLPISTTSRSFVGSLSRSTMLPASFAAWVPEFIARPTSAWARAGASFVPSPIIATSLPSACSFRM